MKSELTAMLNTIEGTDYEQLRKGNNIENLLNYGFKLCQWIARSGELQAQSKEVLHKKRRDAYKMIADAPKGPASKLSPMLIKDYINDCCAEENALYELAERTNRACTHANDLVRTAISALKQERYSQNFSNVA